MAELREITCEPPEASVVEVLEAVLKRARKGELSGVAIAMVTREGATGQEWSRLHSIGTMIGSVSVLEHRLIQGLLE